MFIQLNDPCVHLWCSNVSSAPDVCKTKKGPPMDGTECDDGRWCVDGACRSMDNAARTRMGTGEDSGIKSGLSSSHINLKAQSTIAVPSSLLTNSSQSDFLGGDCISSSHTHTHTNGLVSKYHTQTGGYHVVTLQLQTFNP